MSDEKQVELVSKDEQTVKVPRDVVLQSGLIKDMLEGKLNQFFFKFPPFYR